ncbi:MAG: HIT family protein [Patescibacteria group bacterium]|nr:HIT family protein [Patescibacteria group bacterium]
MAWDCVFCKIVNNEIPCFKVAENDSNLAFLDIAPVNSGHTLVIPKKHYANLEEIPVAELSSLMALVKSVGLAIKAGLNYDGYNIGVNNDPVAGQLIPHLHFHVMPRQPDDGLKLWPQRQYAAGEAEQTANKIKQAIKL